MYWGRPRGGPKSCETDGGPRKKDFTVLSPDRVLDAERAPVSVTE